MGILEGLFHVIWLYQLQAHHKMGALILDEKCFVLACAETFLAADYRLGLVPPSEADAKFLYHLPPVLQNLFITHEMPPFCIILPQSQARAILR